MNQAPPADPELLRQLLIGISDRFTRHVLALGNARARPRPGFRNPSQAQAARLTKHLQESSRATIHRYVEREQRRPPRSTDEVRVRLESLEPEILADAEQLVSEAYTFIGRDSGVR